MKNLILQLLILVLPAGTAFAQAPVLSLEEALRTAVSNNYSIIIAKNEQDAAKYSRNIGNAGMLPTITLNGGATFTNNSIRQNLSSGSVVAQDGVRGDNYIANVQLNWVLFDGLRMFATYGRLTELKERSEVMTRMQIENTISQIMLAYFNVVRVKQVMVAMQENISISEERLKIAEAKFSVGSGAKTEVLQAKIDVNAQRMEMFAQDILLYDSKTNLNQLLARDPATEFDVPDTIPLGAQFENLESVRSGTIEKNSGLLAAEHDIQIAKFTRREVYSLRYPWLTLNTAYNFSNVQNQAGFFLLNQSYGFTGGFTVSATIFDSWRVNTQVKVATTEFKNSTLRYEDLKLVTDMNVVRSYKRYQVALQQLEIQEENVGYADENVNLSLQRFKQGQSNSLELREAQLSYVQTMSSYTEALYNAKAQEIELMRLKGELIK